MKHWLIGLVLPALLLGACGASPNTADSAPSGSTTPDSEAVSADAPTNSDAEDMTAEALAGYDLAQTLTFDFPSAEVGTLTMGYADGYTYFNDFFITSEEGVDANDLFTGMPPGAVFIQLNGAQAGAFGAEDIATYSAEAYTALAENEKISFSDVESVPISGEGIAEIGKQTASKADVYDMALYILQAEGGEYLTVMVYTAPGEIESHEDMVQAMLASANYAP